MTDLDALPFSYGDPPAATPSGARRKAHRHVWQPGHVARHDGETSIEGGYSPNGRDATLWFCLAHEPPIVRDEARSRRGRQSRNYGNRAELDVARRYGGRKVGHAQGPTDVQGVTRKMQVKTSRRGVPPMWAREFAKLESEADGRLAVLVLRFVRAGNLGPEDYFVIKADEFMAWYGRDGE